MLGRRSKPRHGQEKPNVIGQAAHIVESIESHTIEEAKLTTRTNRKRMHSAPEELRQTHTNGGKIGDSANFSTQPPYK